MDYYKPEDTKAALMAIFGKDIKYLDIYAAIASDLTNEKVAGKMLHLVDQELRKQLELQKEGIGEGLLTPAGKRIDANVKSMVERLPGLYKTTSASGLGALLEPHEMTVNEWMVREVGPQCIPRTFHFKRALLELEKPYGFKNYDTILVGDAAKLVQRLVREGATWKDSISFDHGEYTHRLQWLVIGHIMEANGWKRSDLLLLYKDSMTHEAEKDWYPPKGKEIPNSTKPMPCYLWDFLVDCFEKIPAVSPEDLLLHTIRSDSFRSPRNVVKYIMAHQGDYPVLFAYLTSSKAKTELIVRSETRNVVVQKQGEMKTIMVGTEKKQIPIKKDVYAPKTVDVAAGLESFGTYREARSKATVNPLKKGYTDLDYLQNKVPFFDPRL